MIVFKWNVSKGDYEIINLPESYKCRIYCSDLDQIITCPNCGKSLKYGDSYTSRIYHTQFGLGYGVCKECYSAEMETLKRHEL